MEVLQICELGPGTSVWVWIVRVGKGRWWPGSVLSISALEPFPIVDTRFECRSVGRNGTDGPAFVGISSTRMRYLESRDPDLKGDDRPNFVPSAIFAKPEQTEVVLNDIQHSGTMTTVVHATRVSPPTPIKKTRSKKKPKAVSPTQDATVVAIEP
jgi:hypothetical protein